MKFLIKRTPDNFIKSVNDAAVTGELQDLFDNVDDALEDIPEEEAEEVTLPKEEEE